MQLNTLCCTGKPLTPKHYPAQNVNSTKTEKSQSKESDHEKEWDEKEASDTKHGTKFRMNTVGLLDLSFLLILKNDQ